MTDYKEAAFCVAGAAFLLLPGAICCKQNMLNAPVVFIAYLEEA